ncbi:hypothetical protein ATANTOWER_029618 [Ataeniobius toweri]|uniref:E3 ubiquitin-protein ligase HECW1 helical box domain-containing protein n=1 Tax=Ataeniobius toweri TaxID=208326 RepID=A0ABU7B039_9TELE|nr:hypothetical protein [Ataeniobius toweri]
MSLGWPGNALGSPRRSWWRCLGRGTSGYQNIERTMATEEDGGSRSSDGESEPAQTGPSSPINHQKITYLLQSPAVKFITHPEFFTVLHSNYVSASYKNTQM